ncbi:uncharacterized protein FTOL_04458 [Fusarium torulosum]|uniref:Uncharacterized protein n=1 Tax=Fusarium torulosum TaxID=33205 RepID=A0AAE8M5T1_9HYPO|nr:uncharacterized protein FTOL_04458 [Fusarium torulosum]
MVTTKFIIMAMAACVKATPVASAPTAETTKWTGLPVEDTIDWKDVDMDAYKNHSNWNTTANDNVTAPALTTQRNLTWSTPSPL